MRKLIMLLALVFLPSLASASKYTTKTISASVSMGASSNSIGIDVNQLNLSSIQAYWPSTGTPVGSLKVQTSNDNVPVGTGSDPAGNVTHWTDFTGSASAVSGAGDLMYVIPFDGYRWIRLVYTRVSGTGTLTATFSGKGIN